MKGGDCLHKSGRLEAGSAGWMAHVVHALVVGWHVTPMPRDLWKRVKACEELSSDRTFRGTSPAYSELVYMVGFWV